MLVWKKKHCSRPTRPLSVLTNEQFYTECAKILGTVYECEPFPWTHSNRTRWNNRAPGSGRFPGYGLIRCYGDIIHVVLHNPVKINKTFYDKNEALEYISVAFFNKNHYKEL